MKRRIPKAYGEYKTTLCPFCGKDAHFSNKVKLHVCKDHKLTEYPALKCLCGDWVDVKVGRFGKYFGCTSEDCKNTRKLLRSGEAAPPKADPIPMPDLKCIKVEDHYILRDGASGIFLAASQFPRNRETRAPLVAELLLHKDEIDPKYTFLFSAPVKDAKGNPAIVRYSRKTKEQYVMTEEKKKAAEEKAKATGWTAYYADGKWTETQPKPKAKAKPKAKSKAKKA